MIDNYLLEELVTFAHTGTLAQTALQLNVTQPTVTRGMQKLEDDLDVHLFNRQPNKITLTPTGKFAAQQAADLLATNQQFSTRVQNFEHRQKSIKIGTTLPGPLLLFPKSESQWEINSTLQETDQIESLLTNRDFSLIFSNQELLTDQIESRYIGTENLAVNLDQFMFQANQSTISFAELAGLSFIVLDEIGPWRDTIQRAIPDANFMYQFQRQAMLALTTYSNFPYFSTNLSPLDSASSAIDSNQDRVCIPISDSSAQMATYVSYLKDDRQQLMSIIDTITQRWPKE